MTIYVDHAFIRAKVGRYESQWCHLFGDALDPTELHRFAASIGLRRSWFQQGNGIIRGAPFPPHDHYDVTAGKRLQAIAAGAVDVDLTQAVEIWRVKAMKWKEGRTNHGYDTYPL